MRLGHLERFKATLHVLSPLYIGSGIKLTKKEYLLDRDKKSIGIIDLNRMIEYFMGNGKIKLFEAFFLDYQQTDLYAFLQLSGVPKTDYPKFIQYTIDPGATLRSPKFHELSTFIKDSDNLPYIPGSSLKGLIRSAIIVKKLRESKPASDATFRDIERGYGAPFRSKTFLSREVATLEQKIFCNLDLSDTWSDRSNEWTKGLKVSDSQPVGYENMILCAKIDRTTDGTDIELPIYRECLKPGSIAPFTITLDRSVCDFSGITILFIEKALNELSIMQTTSFDRSFPKKDKDAPVPEGAIILGGGAGFVGKSMLYSLQEEKQKIVKMVQFLMEKQIPKHKHYQDGDKGISPRMQKTTKYADRSWMMGRCKITFENL